MFKLLSEYTKPQDERMEELSESSKHFNEWTKKLIIGNLIN